MGSSEDCRRGGVSLIDVLKPTWRYPDAIHSAADASILKNKAHDGPVRGVDFNPIAKNLLASGATNGQVNHTKRLQNMRANVHRSEDLYLGSERPHNPLLPRWKKQSTG